MFGILIIRLATDDRPEGILSTIGSLDRDTADRMVAAYNRSLPYGIEARLTSGA
jgi:hypothetical protein